MPKIIPSSSGYRRCPVETGCTSLRPSYRARWCGSGLPRSMAGATVEPTRGLPVTGRVNTAPAPPELFSLWRVSLLHSSADEHDGCERSMAVSPGVTSQCPARDCSAGWNSRLISRLYAGGRLAFPMHCLCPPGRPRGTGGVFCAEPTENFRSHLCWAESYRTFLGSLNPNGLAVSASQPAKCLTKQNQKWRLRGDPRKGFAAAFGSHGCKPYYAPPSARVANRSGLLPPSIAGNPKAQDAPDAYLQSIELGVVDRPSDSPVNTFATWLLPVHVPFTMYRVPVKIPVQIARHPRKPSA